MPKPLLSVSGSASSTVGAPLFMNGGLIGSLDSMVAMQNLRSGIPGLPISGIMAAGFPHGFSAAVQAGAAGASADDAKTGLNMLPMMLQGVPHPHGAAIPQHTLFTMGAMIAHTPPSPHSSSSPSLSAKVTMTTTPATPEAAGPERESGTSSGSAGAYKDGTPEEGGAAEASRAPGGAEPAPSASCRPGPLHHSAGNSSQLTFNPFLIPGVSHGLLYPHMFLPHGGIMALPTMPTTARDASPSCPRRRRKRGREEGETDEREKSEQTGCAGQTGIASHPDPSSCPPIPPPNTLLSPEGPQIPDSQKQFQGAAEEHLDDTEERGHDVKEQSQVEGEDEQKK